MKTTIELPDALARRAAELARQRQLSLTDLVTEAVRAEVERLSSATPRGGTFRFTTVPGQGLEPDVTATSLAPRAYDPPA